MIAAYKLLLTLAALVVAIGAGALAVGAEDARGYGMAAGLLIGGWLAVGIGGMLCAIHDRQEDTVALLRRIEEALRR